MKIAQFIQITSVFLLVLVLATCTRSEEQENPLPEDEYKIMRKNMVENQIRARGIKDERVLLALENVPRHEFVSAQLHNQAYRDDPLPIGEGQTISQPYIVAYMTEQLHLKPQDKVLEIGTGSGYQAAILAELCDSVFSIEIIPKLSEHASQVLKKLGYNNVYLRVGDGYLGWPEHAPFDAIIVTAAPEKIPQPLIDQLAKGGRMIIPVGDKWQELILLTKTADGIKQKKKIPVRFVPMRGIIEK
ncbi:MAG: protein-L-isoaspartate(D-aspartate) O-methyltransferase [Calditrichia bacterium]